MQTLFFQHSDRAFRASIRRQFPRRPGLTLVELLVTISHHLDPGQHLSRCVQVATERSQGDEDQVDDRPSSTT